MVIYGLLPGSSLTSMRKSLLLVLAAMVLVFALVLYRTLELGRADARPAFLENLNSAGELLGPEGIQFDSRGVLYIGDAQGIIWSLESGGTPQIYARLNQIKQAPGSSALTGSVRAGGIAVDAAGNLYVAVYEFAGGAILRVGADSREVRLFARDMGVVNFVLTTRDDSHLWASDYRIRGRLLRFPLNAPMPVQPDLIVTGLESPNGLALGKDGTELYAAETYSGNIVRVDLTSSPTKATSVMNLRGTLAVGSLDGLAFDPRDADRRFLHVAENLRGIFTVLDLRAKPIRIVKRIRLSTMGGRPCPASMVIRDGYLYFTDLWSCSPIRILLGYPRYREHAYRLRITDLTSIYQ